MNQPVKILYVDENALDRDLILDALERGHGGFQVTAVARREDFENALRDGSYDVVLSDFNILGYAGLQVLDVVLKHDPTLPVIIVTGAGSEEIAVEALMQGAADYVIKHPNHIQRLPRTIYSVLEKLRLEQEHKEADGQIRLLASLLEQTSDAMFSTDPQFIIRTWNAGAEKLYGWTYMEAVGKSFPALVPTSYPGSSREEVLKKFQDDGRWQGEVVQLDRNGKALYVYSTSTWLRDEDGNITGALAVNRDVTDRKLAELERQEIELRYRSIFENSPISIWVEDFSEVKKRLDTLRQTGVNDFAEYFSRNPQAILQFITDVRVLDVNQATMDLYCAKTKAELMGSIEKILPADHRFLFASELVHIAEGKHSFSWEGVNRSLDGREIPVSLNWAVAPGYEETLERVIVSVIDITERKAAEAVLLRQNEYLLALQEMTLGLLSELDINEVLEKIVRRAGELLGTPSAYLELVDTMTGELVPKVGLGSMAEPFQEPVKLGEGMAGIIWETHSPLIVPDYDQWDQRIPRFSKGKLGSVIGVPLKYGDQFLGILGLGYDRETQRKFSSQDAQILEQFARLATIAVQNAQLYRKAQDEIERRKQLELELLTYRDQLEDLVRERTVELEAAKGQAELANRAKSDFLAVISHEMRTPLSGILGLTHLSLQEKMEDKLRQYLSHIKLSGEVLLATINDILDFFKIEATGLEIEATYFQLDDVLKRVASAFAIRAQEKELQLNFEVGRGIPNGLIGDPLRLSQVLLNLVGNAVKFTERGEVELRISLFEQQEDRTILTFTVRDTGIGMSKEQIERLFHPFSQVDTSMSRKYGGTGLGLVISKRLIELMGGTLSLESKLGVGSVFTFALSFLLPDFLETQYLNGTNYKFEDFSSAPVSQPAEAYRPMALFSNRRVLIVEDNEVNCLVAQEMLKHLGLVVDIVTSGQAALSRLRDETYAAVLMDIQMPGMDGFQTTAKIRNELNISPTQLPVIAMTAHALSGERDKALAAGMNDFITKPISPRALEKVLRRWIAPGLNPDSYQIATDTLITEEGGEKPPEKAGRVLIRLNRPEAIARLGGNQNLYNRLLQKFRDQEASMVCELRQALQSGNLSSAHHLTHTLQSVSATLGAEALSDAVKQLNTALKENHPRDYDNLLANIEHELELLIVEISGSRS